MIIEKHIQNRKRAIIYGVFDITHKGHYEKFRLLKEMGYEVVVGIVSDRFASSYKRTPILNETERWYNVYACKWVDEVFISESQSDNKKFEYEIYARDIDVVVHGADWAENEYRSHMCIGPRHCLLSLPYLPEISTTEIIKRCRKC